MVQDELGQHVLVQGTLLGEDGGHRVDDETQAVVAQRLIQLVTRSGSLACRKHRACVFECASV